MAGEGVKARAAETGGALGLVETVIPAGHSTPLHVHRNEDEAIFILAGTVDFVRGDERFRAEDGAFVFLPRTVPHTFLGISEEPTRALVMFMPGGLEEAFAEPSRFHEILEEQRGRGRRPACRLSNYFGRRAGRALSRRVRIASRPRPIPPASPSWKTRSAIWR